LQSNGAQTIAASTGSLTVSPNALIPGGGTATYNITQADGDTSLVLGTNTTKRGYIKLHGITSGRYGVIQMTTSNLHLDADTGLLYLNHYGTGNVVVGTSGITDHKLSVNGTARVTSTLRFDADLSSNGTVILNNSRVMSNIVSATIGNINIASTTISNPTGAINISPQSGNGVFVNLDTGVIRLSRATNQVNLMLRPNAGNSAYITITEDAIADK
jgi:hypothetical protein